MVMQIVDDLVTWLGAQLDEDERVSRAAVAPFLRGRWRFDGTLSSIGPVVVTGDAAADRWVRDGNKSVWTCDDPEDGCPGIAALWDAEGEHIARWDPARVLAQVEAKRALLADLMREEHFLNDREWYGCRSMREAADGDSDDEPTGQPCTCGLDVTRQQRIRLLALPYRDRPGYRPEWAPEAVP